MVRDASIHVNARRIGPAQPTYIVAELSANHNQRYEQAVELVKAAKDAGADAVKLQTYTPDTLTIQSEAEPFRVPSGNLWSGQTLYELYSQAYMPWEWQPRLMALARELGLDCFSTPFDRTAVDFLSGLDVPAYKIASFELIDLPLIEYVARQGKPVILSTGLSTLAEVDEAVRVAKQAGATEIALLKCNSAYPAPASEMNLRTIPHLMQLYGVPVGLSDHTLGSAVAVAGVALGASIVEKHFTLSRAITSPDAAFSMEPDEFKRMVQEIRLAEEALGVVSYEPTPEESKNRLFRRSLFVVKDLEAGELFTEDNVRSIRPEGGLSPRHLHDVLGRRAATRIRRGTPLTWPLVDGGAGTAS